ncbi:MAG: MoxR family ATPase [Pseudomonadota bacterium]
METAEPDEQSKVEKQAEQTAELLGRARESINSVILGQDTVIDNALVALLCGGHALLVGLPGLAKTKLVETLGTVLSLTSRRVQFTPDLLPSDILGAEVLEESSSGKRGFRFIEGPIFSQLLMADEINRASPRTQSALLQAMQERHVTVAGVRHDLPAPFHVLATQNPVEQEGTYPLPEAQLDRFLLEIEIGFPDREAEMAMLKLTTGSKETEPVAALSSEQLMQAQALVRAMPIGEKVVENILDLVRGARPGSSAHPVIGDKLDWGPGPRASQALMLATRARALLGGRLSPTIDDVAALAEPILRHRMALTYAARAEGATRRELVAKLVEAVL